jgi:hypothetical protein
MDDLEPHHESGVGPALAWREAEETRLVVEDLLVENGFPLSGLGFDDVGPHTIVRGLGHYRSGS